MVQVATTSTLTGPSHPSGAAPTTLLTSHPELQKLQGTPSAADCGLASLAPASGPLHCGFLSRESSLVSQDSRLLPSAHKSPPQRNLPCPFA